MLNMEPPGRRNRGRPQRRVMDVVNAEGWCDIGGIGLDGAKKPKEDCVLTIHPPRPPQFITFPT